MGERSSFPERRSRSEEPSQPVGLEARTTMSTDQLIALLVLVIMIVQLAVKKGKS